MFLPKIVDSIFPGFVSYPQKFGSYTGQDWREQGALAVIHHLKKTERETGTLGGWFKMNFKILQSLPCSKYAVEDNLAIIFCLKMLIFNINISSQPYYFSIAIPYGQKNLTKAQFH